MALIAHYLCNNPEVLPKEYIRVEYLLNSDTSSYFNCGFTGNLNTRLEGEVEWVSGDYFNPFGDSTADNSLLRRIQFVTGAISRFGTANVNFSNVIKGKYITYIDKYGFGILGKLNYNITSQVSNFTTSGNIKLFRSIESDTYKGIHKIYSFKVSSYSSNSLVIDSTTNQPNRYLDPLILQHNYIPCKRKSDSVLGFYDTVTDSFLTGTGTFTAGSEITEFTEVNATGGDGTLINLDINIMSHINRQSTCSKTVDSNGVMTVTLNSITGTNPGIYFKNCLFSGVNSGHTYTWQVYLRTDKSGGMVIQQLGVSDGTISNVSINSEWQRFEHTFTLSSASRNVVFYASSAAANGDSFQIKDFRVVRAKVTSPLLPGSNGISHNVSIVKRNDLPLYDYCYEFNGTNSYIRTNWDLSKYPLNHYTLSCWVKHDSNDSTATNHPIIRSSTGNAVTIDVYYNLDYYYRGFHFTSTGNNYSDAHNVLVPDRNWHLLTLTFDGSTKKLYLDSVLKNTCSSDAPVLSGLLYIGAGYVNQNMRYFKGFLQDIRIYNEALTAEEVQQLYNLKKI